VQDAGRTAQPRTMWPEFFLSRVLVFVVSRTSYGDLQAYFDGVSRLATKGNPYGEDGFGYPVLAFLFVSIPWLFEARTFALYYPFYRAQCFAVDVLLFFLLRRRSSRETLLVYIFSTAAKLVCLLPDLSGTAV
jgi:hypothetical protein